MLNTDKNTKTMCKRVETAARKILHTRKISSFFEHGQWWIEDRRNGAQYSVVDAEGGSAVNGFDLEMVTEPQEF